MQDTVTKCTFILYSCAVYLEHVQCATESIASAEARRCQEEFAQQSMTLAYDEDKFCRYVKPTIVIHRAAAPD